MSAEGPGSAMVSVLDPNDEGSEASSIVSALGVCKSPRDGDSCWEIG